MKNLFRTKSLGIFQKFLISYMIILIASLFIGITINNSVTKMLERSAFEANLSLLEQTRDIMDSKIEELNNIAVQLSWNNKLSSLLNLKRPLKYSDYYRLYDIRRSIKDIHLTNSFITTFYIHLKNSNIIISPDAVYTDMYFFYRYCFNYGTIKFEDWYNEMLERYNNGTITPANLNTIKGKQSSSLIYLQSIPIESLSQFSGSIMFLIDEQEIKKLFNGFNICNGGWLYIFDKDGSMLTNLNQGILNADLIDITQMNQSGYMDCKINNKVMSVFYATSDYNGWTYIAVLPKNIVLQTVRSVNMISWGIIACTLLLGLLMAYLFAYKNSKPVKDLISKVKEYIGNDRYKNYNEYDSLELSVSSILFDNESLRKRMHELSPLIRAAFFDRLFKGEFTSLKEIETASDFNNLNLNSSKYAVLVMKENEIFGELTKSILDDLYNRRLVLKKAIEDTVEEYGYMHDIGDDKLAILLSLNSDCSEDINDVITTISDRTKNATNFMMTIGVGRIYDSLMDVSSSFIEANKAVEYNIQRQTSRIVWYEDIPMERNSYYYPIDIELRLINLVKSGEVNELNKMLNNIYNDNFIKRNLDDNMIKHLVLELYHTVIKLIDQISLVNPSEVMEWVHNFNCDSINSIYSLFEIYKRLCRDVNYYKKSHNYVLKDQIVNYISSNYANPNLCLSSVAGQFGLTEVYLSQFFQEQTGEKFSSYLEQIRMLYAENLLVKSDQSINQIAQAVGYNSANSFTRAYKRVNGITPTIGRHSGKQKGVFS